MDAKRLEEIKNHLLAIEPFENGGDRSDQIWRKAFEDMKYLVAEVEYQAAKIYDLELELLQAGRLEHELNALITYGKEDIERLRGTLENIEQAYPELDEYTGNKLWVKCDFMHRLQNIAREALKGGGE